MTEHGPPLLLFPCNIYDWDFPLLNPSVNALRLISRTRGELIRFSTFFTSGKAKGKLLVRAGKAEQHEVADDQRTQLMCYRGRIYCARPDRGGVHVNLPPGLFQEVHVPFHFRVGERQDNVTLPRPDEGRGKGTDPDVMKQPIHPAWPCRGFQKR